MYVKKKEDQLSQQDIKRYNRMIWKVAIGAVVIFVLLLGFTDLGLFGTLPTFNAIENPKSFQASEIISSDKQILGTYYVQNRSSITY